MEKCKYCQAELEENSTVCPQCGKDNAEMVQEEAAAEAVESTETVEEAAPAAEVTEAVEETPAEEVSEEAAEEASVGEAEETPAEEVPAEEPAAEEKPTEIKEGVKATPGKIAVAVVAVIVLLAVLIALLVSGLGSSGEVQNTEPAETSVALETEETVPATVPEDGNPDDETCKGTYTASDEEVIAAADTVVATMGEHQLTNAQLQIYYWLSVQSFVENYGYAAYYQYGFDYTQPLDTQACGLTGYGTWQQYFLADALLCWQNYQAFAAEAESLDEAYVTYLENLPQSLEENAQYYGFADAKEMLAYSVGNGAEVEDYVHFMELYYWGYARFEQLYNAIAPTDEEIDAYFTEHEADYNTNGITRDGGDYVDVRHILLTPEGGTTDENGTVTYSEEEWAACEAAAQAVLDEWLAGDMTEDSFAELANTYTADGNDADYDGIPDGGLYTQVSEGVMVEPFENWCFDETRVAGDYGLVKTVYGWHVMYFVDRYPIWHYRAESDLFTVMANQMVDDTIAKYPLEVDYSAILLGYVDMSA